MSREREFRNQPLPGDWTLPPEFAEAWSSGENPLDPVGLSLLKESEFDGVPIPFGFQSAKELADQLERLETGENPTTIAAEIIVSTAEREQRYPDTGMWDRSRVMATTVFIEHGHPEEAFDLAATVKNSRLLVRTIIDSEAIDDAVKTELFAQLVQRGDEQRQVGIARAVRDYLVENEPQDPLIETYNQLILQQTDQTDWVHDWVESQREIDPDVDWDVIEPLLNNDDVYQSMPMPMPMPMRMYTQLIFIETLKEITNDAMSEGFSESVLTYYENGETGIYAQATIWGHEKGNIAKVLLEKGHIETATTIAASIRDPKLMATMVMEFVAQEQEEAAAEVAIQITDHRLSAEMLLDGNWQSTETPIGRFIEVIESDNYPPEKRIGFLEVVRDRMIDGGAPDKATEYQQRIDDIREKASDNE